MRISEQGLALLRVFEGFSARVYLCPAGKRTVGYGHVVRPGEVFPGDMVTLEQAELLLKQDVSVAEQGVVRLAGEQMTQGQLDALVCFVYNVGAYAFEKSSLLRFFLAGDMVAAAGQFDRWIYANGKPLSGLVRRREAEKALFLS